jgi:thiol-disulfide isomerase/thioredoxin
MDHDAALRRARDEGRNVIVMFTGAWWCPHCQPLERMVLTHSVWQSYVETNGLYLVMFDNPGRADQYWCWLRETNYVEAVAGITLEEGESAITNRYAIQTSYAVPSAPTQTVKGVSYLKVGYPTLIGVRPDGTRLGRFTPLNTTVSLDMVLRNVSQILSGDDWDEADDYYQGATGLVAPVCEDEEAYSGTHTLSEPDAADWYAFDAVAGAQWSFRLAATATSVTNELRAQLFADPASGASVAERQMAPSAIAVLSYTIPQTGRYWLKVSRFTGLKQLQAYDLAYWYGTPPATVRFAVDRLMVSERVPTVTLTVNISGASNDAEVRVSYETDPGTALPGLDYVDAQGELVWSVGPKRAKMITVPLLPDGVWEGDETFRVALYAVKNCFVGEQLAVCDVVLQEQTMRVPGRLGFEPAAAVTLPEGSNALFSVQRLAGSNGAVSGRVEQVSGNTRKPVATLVWANGESDAKAFAFAFTNEPGWQADRACSLKLTPLGGASLLSATVGTVALTRRDDLVVQPLAEYAAEAANLLPGLRAVGGVWFYGYFSDDDRAGAWLRSGSVAARATTTVSATLTGPGVLGFDRRSEGDDSLMQFVLGGTS